MMFSNKIRAFLYMLTLLGLLSLVYLVAWNKGFDEGYYNGAFDALYKLEFDVDELLKIMAEKFYD